MTQAMQNATFKAYMAAHGLPIDASAVLNVSLIPGPSILQQAAELGYPSTVYTASPIPNMSNAFVSAPHNTERLLIAALCGSFAIAALCSGEFP